MNIGIPVYGNNTTSINTAYLEYVNAAGYEPVLINDNNNISVMAEFCDALMLPGGGDIDPVHYFDNNLSSYSTNPYKDTFERDCLDVFLESDKPIFGICRGFQLILRELVIPYTNELIYFQHVSGHSQTGENKTDRYNPSHFVVADMDLLKGEDEGIYDIAVNSMHHQAIVMKAKSGIHVSGSIGINGYNVIIAAVSNYAVPDRTAGIVEAVVIPDKRITAVQWHPEELNDTALLSYALRE